MLARPSGRERIAPNRARNRRNGGASAGADIAAKSILPNLGSLRGRRGNTRSVPLYACDLCGLTSVAFRADAAAAHRLEYPDCDSVIRIIFRSDQRSRGPTYASARRRPRRELVSISHRWLSSTASESKPYSSR